MAITKNIIIPKIEELVIRSSEFQSLEEKVKYFCPFEAVGLIDQEIRHAHFLSYVLDPNRPHGFEDAYLRAFLHVAAESYSEEGSSFRPIDIHFANLSNARIVREKDRVDLRIELINTDFFVSSRIVLIFELKIKAVESSGQLKKYTRQMEEEYQDAHLIFFFLTLDGGEASDENRCNWTPLALSDVIARFDKVSQREVGRENARQMVQSYCDMMRRRHFMQKNDELQELARKLWSEHAEALEFLVQAQPDDVSGALVSIFENQEALCEKLSEVTGLEFMADVNSNRREIILFPSEWDHLNLDKDDRRLFVLVIDRNYGDRDTLRFRWLLRRGDVEMRRLIYDKIIGKKRAYSATWTQIFVKRYKLDEGLDLDLVFSKIASFSNEKMGRMSALHKVSSENSRC